MDANKTPAYLLERFNVVKSMNTLVLMMNDEDAYGEWIYTVPDQADDTDLIDIAANDDLFSDAVKDFYRIWKDYARQGGLYIGHELFDAKGLVKK